jgi:hypothetical protein
VQTVTFECDPKGPIRPKEHIVNIFSELCVAGLTCIVMAAGTIAANANIDPANVATSTISTSSIGTTVALNPQPLPPFVDEHDDDFDFRG